MVTSLDVSAVLVSARMLLDADVSLNGAGMLGASGRIFTYRAPRDKVQPPYLVVTMLPMGQTDSSTYAGELRVTARVNLLSNGQIQRLCDQLTARVFAVLDNEILTVAGGGALPLKGLGIVPSLVDQIAPGESFSVARFAIEAGMSG
jgi:hypothetical protein